MAATSAEARRAAMLKRRSPVDVGDMVTDKYRVERLLAAGGMGVVVVAVHEALGQRVAIKFLHAMDEDEHAAARFLREARAAARIQSEHVARVFDCGTTEAGVAYMVMEYLDGADLAQELKEKGRLPVAEAVDVLLQAMEGIADAHALGIVHRDIKPANLFLATRAGAPRCVKVLDFGISKLEAGPDAVDDGLTATSAMLGSPRYMSPEQAQSSKTVDARTDVWSLGVVLYEALDGHSPFAGDTMGETLGRVLTSTPPPIERRRPDLPDGLSQVITRCLQRDREHRFRNVAELALALAPFGSGRATASVERITGLLVGGQLASGKLVASPSPGTPPPSRATAADELPTRRTEPTGAATSGSAPEQTAGNWAQHGEHDPTGRGRIPVIVAACASIVAALAIGMAFGASRKPAAPAIAAAPGSGVLAPLPTLGETPTPAEPPTPPAPPPTAPPLTTASISPASAPPPVKPHPTPAPGKRAPRVDILGGSD